MHKMKQKERLRKRYLEDFKWITNKQERIDFIKELIKEAKDHKINDYEKLFEGILKTIDRDYSNAQKLFYESLELNNELPYTQIQR